MIFKKKKFPKTFFLKLFLKIFNSWHDYSNNHVIKRFHDETKIDEFKAIDKKLILRKYYEKWKRKKYEKLSENEKSELADGHYAKCVNSKLLIRWKLYTKIAKQNKMMQIQADHFNRMRLQLNIYTQWSFSFEKIMIEKQKNNRAICHWAWQLEKKMFLNWILYVSKRKEKKRRYDEAIKDRQLEIIKNSLKHFLVYSADARDRRLKQNMFVTQQRFVVDSNLALKYYSIWKEKYLYSKKIKQLTNRSDKTDSMSRTRTPRSYFTSQTPTNTLIQQQLSTRSNSTSILNEKPIVFTNEPPIRISTRPQPRKPMHLLESITSKISLNFDEKENENNQVAIVINESQLLSSIENDNQTYTIENDVGGSKHLSLLAPSAPRSTHRHQQSSLLTSILTPRQQPQTVGIEPQAQKPILLPPTVFATLPPADETVISSSSTYVLPTARSSTILNGNNRQPQQQQQHQPQSRSSSVTTFATEINNELEILKSFKEIKKQEQTHELIKLKERLENLTAKKDRLKYVST